MSAEEFPQLKQGTSTHTHTLHDTRKHLVGTKTSLLSGPAIRDHHSIEHSAKSHSQNERCALVADCTKTCIVVSDVISPSLKYNQQNLNVDVYSEFANILPHDMNTVHMVRSGFDEALMKLKDICEPIEPYAGMFSDTLMCIGIDHPVDIYADDDQVFSELLTCMTQCYDGKDLSPDVPMQICGSEVHTMELVDQVDLVVDDYDMNHSTPTDRVYAVHINNEVYHLAEDEYRDYEQDSQLNYQDYLYSTQEVLDDILIDRAMVTPLFTDCIKVMIEPTVHGNRKYLMNRKDKLRRQPCNGVTNATKLYTGKAVSQVQIDNRLEEMCDRIDGSKIEYIGSDLLFNKQDEMTDEANAYNMNLPSECLLNDKYDMINLEPTCCYEPNSAISMTYLWSSQYSQKRKSLDSWFPTGVVPLDHKNMVNG